MFLLPVLRSVTTVAAIFFVGIACARVSKGEEQNPKIDPAAEKRIRAMSDYFDELESLSVEVVHEIEMQPDLPEAEYEMPSQVVTFSNWEVGRLINGETFAIEVPENAEQVVTL